LRNTVRGELENNHKKKRKGRGGNKGGNRREKREKARKHPLTHCIVNPVQRGVTKRNGTRRRKNGGRWKTTKPDTKVYSGKFQRAQWERGGPKPY